MKKRGKFIVIEGTDGSGKATQIALLKKRLEKTGQKVELADFPQYGKPSAFFVEKYLRGEYGTAADVGAYRGSMFYALDRFDKSFEIRKWLAEGKTVLSNRYVSANMGHQAGKISDRKKRDKFLVWLNGLEYGIFGIPKPDLTLLLYVDPAAAQKFVDLKGKRAYTKGKKRDLHEADLGHLKRAAEAYRYVSKKYRWTIIDCMEGVNVLPIDKISEKIFESLKKLTDN